MKKLVLIAAVMLGAACQNSAEGPSAQRTGASHADPIIGGAAVGASDWRAVGALAYWDPFYGFGGSFCSATLIDPLWVLTAAHCVTGDGGGGASFNPTPQTTRFYVGNDARATWSSSPSSGNIYAVQSFHVHPNWDNENVGSGYDIALVRLSAPLNSVTPIPYNTSALTAAHEGMNAFYVGFGVNNEANGGSGDGIKRSANLTIVDIFNRSYQSSAANPAVCYGDSGGPGLLQFSGTWRAIGINSYVMGGCVGFGSVQTRVDYYATWIAGVMSGTPTSCTNDPSLCICPAACVSGSCNNAVCQTYDCLELYDCMNNCSTSDCAVDCYNLGTSTAQGQYNDMQDCFVDECSGLSGPAFQTCAQTECANEINTCFGIGSGTATCSDTYDCLIGCPSGDQTCYGDCYTNASSLALNQLDAMWTCWDDNCASPTEVCVEANCGQQTRTCMGGGSAPEGSACTWFADCANGFGCKTGKCRRLCNPAAPNCAGGQVCLATGICDPLGASCACDTTTNVCNPGCDCDPVCNPNCGCDDTFGCDQDGTGRECYCDQACPSYCPCNHNPGCASGCGCDTDCPCACDVDSKCSPGCACDLNCYIGCTCDTSDACEDGCACDQDCNTGCACNTSSACNAGCACDEDCNQVCTCDTTNTCDNVSPGTPCSCDPQCSTNCACDLTAGCDAGCACDPICTSGCPCDATAGSCDEDCGCDTECCLCDVTPLCDGGCACDPKCSNSCACDVTPLCDGGCACDPKCGNACPGNTTPQCDGVACDPDCQVTGGTSGGGGSSGGSGGGSGNTSGTAGTSGNGGNGGGNPSGGGCASAPVGFDGAWSALVLMALWRLRRRR